MFNKRRFTKEELYQRFPHGTWQDRWFSHMGPCFVLTSSVREVVNFIYFPSTYQNEDIYIKLGDVFLKIGEKNVNEVRFDVNALRGEGPFVGKALLPVGGQLIWGVGITGSKWQKVSKLHRSYVKEWVTEGWQSEKQRVFLKLDFQEFYVYGEEWERILEKQSKKREDFERQRAIKRATKWCKEQCLEIINEEILFLLGQSILEEEEEMRQHEEREIKRLLLGCSYDDNYDYDDGSRIFYEGPEKLVPKSFKIRDWLSFFFYGPREYPI
ncbi:MAG: hypothetical protein QW228_07000 [Candidatus Aenigmatarchaeota archaeon]